ncbi:MAG: hypothetical protein AAF597_08510 [Bacteroidota bacterium]
MTRLFLPLLLVLLIGGNDLLAQVTPRVLPVRAEDAIRFGNVEPLGTARFLGTGGSMTAIGVDYTTLHTNPAGIGWNRYSKVQLTPGFTLTPTSTNLRGNASNGSNSASAPTVNLPSLGLIYAQPTRSVSMKSFNIGVGLTRLADFNETISFEGYSEGSIMDAIVEDLNDNIQDPFRSDLVFDIDNAVQQDELGFFSDFDLESSLGGQTRKVGTVERSGSLNEFALGAGGNYNDKLLWGATIGIPFVNFSETRTYDEIDDRDEITFFDNASYDENLEFSGSGVNFKFGVIYLPTFQSRISLAVHSPTFWTIDETYSTQLEYNFTDNGVAQGGTAPSELSEAALNLRTPWRFRLGGGYIIGRSGFVSVEADYANYAGSSFSFDDFTTLDNASNEDIDATLGSSIAVRFGGELNLKPFQVRAGVGYRTVPNLDLRYEEDSAALSASLGAGWAKDKIFIDFAVRAEQYNGFYAPYRTFAFDGNVVDTERTRLTALLTVGYRGF